MCCNIYFIAHRFYADIGCLKQKGYQVFSMFRVTLLVESLWTNNFIQPLKCGVTQPAVTTNIHSLWHRLWTCPQNGKLCMKAVKTLISIKIVTSRGDGGGGIGSVNFTVPEAETLRPPPLISQYIWISISIFLSFSFFVLICGRKPKVGISLVSLSTKASFPFDFIVLTEPGD